MTSEKTNQEEAIQLSVCTNKDTNWKAAEGTTEQNWEQIHLQLVEYFSLGIQKYYIIFT